MELAYLGVLNRNASISVYVEHVGNEDART